MSMDLSQLDALCSDLTVAARTLRGLCDKNSSSLGGRHDSATDSVYFSTTTSEEGDDISVARRKLCGTVTRLQTLLAGPSYFIHQLAIQNQLLACLKWLGEYQVIACVPLSGSISIEGLADLADVPESILSRVVRMTATAGFLHEPDIGYVAHTPLSASFTTELSYFDAAMFLANNVAPSALNLTMATRKLDEVLQPFSSRNVVSNADILGVNSPHSFASACAEGPQLSRQWSAYCGSVAVSDDTLTSLFNQLNWQGLGEATIVHVCARYTEATKALVRMSLSLRVIVQTFESMPSDIHRASSGWPALEESISNRIVVQRRKPTSPQSVRNAAVYILQPSLSPLNTDGWNSHELVTGELQSHLDVLRANQSALLILAPALLPEPGSVAVNVEVQARLRDFANLQFGNESALEVTELFKLVESVGDRHGRLIVTKRLRAPTGATIALAMKYQSIVDNNQPMTEGDIYSALYK